MQKINLKDRGYQVIECIDLFDEARYGADKLFFRGRFETLDDVKKQVQLALSDNEFKDENGKEIKLGNGNPLIDVEKVGMDNCPIIALNRYHIPNKKFWNNVVPSDVENPYKASAAVRFSIRVHFRDDFAYIDFSCPWELVEIGNITDESDAQTFIDNFVLLHCHFISKEDALQILKVMFPNIINVTESVKAYKRGEYNSMTIETTELVDEDGTIIAL